MEPKTTAVITQTENKLPQLADLYELSNLDNLFKQDQFNLLMNQEPNPKWVQQNKYAGNSNYIPIGIIETLLQRVFKDFKIEVLREGTMFNSVYVAVRLHYLNPINSVWEFFDGLGAAQVQTKSGSSPANLADINNNAVQMALPMAKSYAIKDAAEHIGKLFGRDLNRKETMGYSPNIKPTHEEVSDAKQRERIKDHINKATSLSKLEQVKAHINDEELQELYINKANELKPQK